MTATRLTVPTQYELARHTGVRRGDGRCRTLRARIWRLPRARSVKVVLELRHVRPRQRNGAAEVPRAIAAALHDAHDRDRRGGGGAVRSHSNPDANSQADHL